MNDDNGSDVGDKHGDVDDDNDEPDEQRGNVPVSIVKEPN